MLWSTQRADYLNRRMANIVRQDRMTFSFVPSPSTNSLRYFSEDLHLELAEFSPEPFVYVHPESDSAADADIVIHIASGNEEDAARLWDDRLLRRPDALCALWLWDNHICGVANRQVTTAADVVFASHGYVSDYLVGPAALLSGQIPACSAQWTRDEAERFFQHGTDMPRKHKILFNYVDYGQDYPTRRRILETLADGLVPIENLQMTRHDKSRYFSLSRQDRFLEWMRYKATVIVPVDRDLSTRVFDALLSGIIPIIPEYIPDADHVIPRPKQERLGIIRVPDFELQTVQAAVYNALDQFDEMGVDGAMARHRYALENHMLINRITAILETIWRIGTGELSVVFGKQDEVHGLFLRRNGG